MYDSDTTLIVAVLGLLYGLIRIVVGVFEWRKAVASRSWPTVEARVLSTEVKNGWGGRSVTYVPVVRYEYSIDGRTYTSEKLTVMHKAMMAKAADAEKYIERFPVGLTVKAYHRPGKPEEAVLQVGDADEAYASFFYGGLSVAIGLLLLWHPW